MRLMILPSLLGAMALGPVLIGLAVAQPAAARTGCDGRCFSGPNDRLADSEALWQRADASDPAEISGDPLALAHGTIGEPMQDLADDD